MDNIAEVGDTDTGHQYETKEQDNSLSWLKEQAKAGIPLWAICCICNHSRLMDASDLLLFTHQNTKSLTEISDRMRCTACGSKACELRPATPIPEYLIT